MKHYDKTAEDIYRYLRGEERREAMAKLCEALRMEQELRGRLARAKRMLKVS